MTTDREDTNSAAAEHLALIRASAFFDAQWYLRRNPDVARSGVDPALHYLKHGGFENRDPGPDFASHFYLSIHPDVAEAGFNPLLHYLLHGQEEGRAYAPYGQSDLAADEGNGEAIAAHIATMAHKPLLSVLVPVHNTNPVHLRQMLASVGAQSWPNWELCIADDASTDGETGEILRLAAAAEPRIKLTFRPQNGHISAATNSALALASGEFACLLDHDDLLHQHALYEVAAALEAHPDADLIYTDSDLIDENGHRFAPYFKTDWDPDLILGHNMVSHFGCYRRSLLIALGGLRLGYEGSQDYDLALRVADASAPERIHHIPAVLYHWRQVSTASSFSQKWLDQCVAKARRAIADHLARRGVVAELQPVPGMANFTRVVHALPEELPRLSIGLIAKGAASDLLACASLLLFRAEPAPDELLVVHPAATTAAARTVLAMLAQDERVRLISVADPPDIATLRNRAIAEASGEVMLLLDADLMPQDPSWLHEMLSQALRPGVGLVGCRLIEEEGRAANIGLVLNAQTDLIPMAALGQGGHGVKALLRTVSALPSACMAFRRAPVLAAGMLEGGIAARDAAIGLSRRMQAMGLRHIHTPFAQLHRANPRPQILADFQPVVTDTQPPAPPASHGEDPYYNPNLALDGRFEYAATPSRRVGPWEAHRRPAAAMLSGQAARASLLIGHLPKEARLLEIGPSYNPLAPRSEGWNTTIIDHASQADLVAKYHQDPHVSTERIEAVDFVWSEGVISDAVDPALRGSFDALLASHVIEHVPDFVGFLDGAARLLRPSGSVILAVPDKRFCFDYFRPLTNTAHVLEAHQQRRSRHPARTAYEQYAYCINNNGMGAWGQESVKALSFTNDVPFAYKIFSEISEAPASAYLDLHVWQFTPSSFALMIMELAQIGLLDWQIERITPAAGCEFHVWLRRGGKAEMQTMPPATFNARRMALLQAMIQELAQQASFAPLGHGRA